MKIAFDAKRALNNSSGLGNYSRNLLNGLMSHFPENEYLLFSPKAKDEFFHQLQGNFKIYFPETKFQKAFHPLWRSFGISKQIQKERADIYHGLGNEIPFSPRPSHSPLVPLVVTIHDLIFLKHKEQYPFFDRTIYELKTKYATKHADKVIAVSNETKKDLIEKYGVKDEKIEVIYPIVNSNYGLRITDYELNDKLNLPSKYILNVGSFFSRKNQKILIEAFDLIKNKVEEDLLLVGNGGYSRKELEELILKKNLQQRVSIRADITNEDLPLVYAKASVFVYPSLFEGFGMPIVEALLSKVTVIATKGGCFEEAGGKSSIYVNPKSEEEIADAILKVLNDEKLKAQMIESGFAHAQTMSEEILSEKIMQVYYELNAR